MWPKKDSNKYMSYNGISNPIYSCDGNLNYSLPLHMYPPVDDVHPQIKMVRRMHLNHRGDNIIKDIPPTLRDYRLANIPARFGWSGQNVENFTHPNFTYNNNPIPSYVNEGRFIESSNVSQQGKLPNPNGRGCSACSMY